MWAGFVTIWFWVGDQHEQTMGDLEIVLLYRQEYGSTVSFDELHLVQEAL